MSAADRQAALVAGATEEGQVSFYSSVNDDVNAGWKDGFEGLYPEISVNTLQMNAADNLTRSLTEERAGSHEHDVNVNASNELGQLHAEGFVADNPGHIRRRQVRQLVGSY
jgi:hypothetical protein